MYINWLSRCVITHNLIIVGPPAIASCISDIETTRGTIKEWLHNKDIIVSTTSTKQLELVFSTVNDSIHGQVYVCRVTYWRRWRDRREKLHCQTVDGILIF